MRRPSCGTPTRRVETILADLAVLRAAGELYLLVQPTALDDLRLDDGQRAQGGRALRPRRRALDRNLRRPRPSAVRPSERVRIALEQARANEAEVDAILTPTQRVRLRQIALQTEGPAAFREPEVVEALGLTPAQRERIRAIEEEAFRGRFARCNRENPAKTQASRRSGASSPSSPTEQARRWNEMAGEPVRGPLSAFPVPFRPQREPKRASPSGVTER